MNEMKERFSLEVAARLAAAPESAAKTELVEELADNLYQRYLDLSASGLGEEEAFSQAMEGLGEVDELVDYLNSLAGEPEQEPPHSSASDPLEELLRDVESITRNVITSAKNAVQEAKKRLDEDGFLNYRSRNGRVEVDIISGRDPQKREVHYKTDRVYGVGYDKSKGGFYAQWGEWKGGRENVAPEMPVSPADLRGLDIQNTNGDVTIHFFGSEDEDLSFSGDVAQLEVSRTEDGILVVRQGRTASASSLFRRGLESCDVELTLPCRSWDTIRIRSVNGDVDIAGGCHVEDVNIEAVNGDIDGDLGSCVNLELKTASGDIDWTGCCAEEAFVEAISGDIDLNGGFNRLNASSMSGDIELAGSVVEVKCSSMSGDIRLETGSVPVALHAASKSGDCHVRLPDEDHSPFTARLRTVSGDIDSHFPCTRVPGGLIAESGAGGPEFTVSTVSGDIDLDVY